jgi:hypothetical protein
MWSNNKEATMKILIDIWGINPEYENASASGHHFVETF